MRAMCRCVTIMLGAQYVMIAGELLIPMLPVVSLDYNPMVYILLCYNVIKLFKGSQFHANNYFQVADNPSFVYGRFYCSGSEKSLVDCPISSLSLLLSCSSNEIVGIQCVG